MHTKYNDEGDDQAASKAVQNAHLFRDLNKVAVPFFLKILKFLESTSIQARLHNGFLLTQNQSIEIKDILTELVTAVAVRRRELMFSEDSNVEDFDLLGYLGVGKLLFVLSTFIDRISVKTNSTNSPGISNGKMFCGVLCKVACGVFGIAGGNSTMRKKKLCSCGPQNILFLKQSFSSSLAIFLASLLFIIVTML